MQLRIVGAGWAGLAAAVAACERGWSVQLWDASHHGGGRARALPDTASGAAFDNGQHILIGAYQATLALMRTVGVDPDAVLWRTPLDLRDAQGRGLRLPAIARPWHVAFGAAWGVAWGVVWGNDWPWSARWALCRAALAWQRQGFACPAEWSVTRLCQVHGLPAAVVVSLIEPLCLSALNTHPDEASAQVFLRVLHDGLLGGRGASDLLLPRTDLSSLLVTPALQWLRARGAQLHLGAHITAPHFDALVAESSPERPLLLAVPSREAARLCEAHAPAWAQTAAQLQARSIATVYLQVHDAGFAGLTRPMQALQSHADAPAQFVFCRQTLCHQPRSLAAVVSDCGLSRASLATQVQAQVQAQLGLRDVRVVQTLIDRHATFACTPGLQRPPAQISAHLWACGDYVQGPYPATLEGAVRSGQQVIAQLAHMR